MAGMRRFGVPVIGIVIVILTAVTVARARGARANVAAADRAAPPLASAPIRAEGRIVTYPGATIEVRSEIGGRLVLLRVQEQQRVRRGDVVAAIAADEVQAALAEAQAQIEAADVDTSWLATELQRITPLVQTGSLSRQALDRATHELAAARARRTVAEATVRRLTATVAKTRIIAPIDGTIVSRAVEPGEVLMPGMRVVTIVDLEQRRIEADVDEYDAERVHPGDSVTITAEGYGAQTWEGTVESVADVIVPRRVKPQDPGRFSDVRVLPVKVRLPRDAPLRVGQRVELAFHSSR